jgi:membrane associated rhomboid family serine protease/ribosomal protein L37AE/L43A
MNCPKCSNELEIFARDGKEIYVCPFCLSGLIPNESSLKILKYFCNEEIMSQLISALLDDSLFDNAKTMLSAEENLACPKCKSYMQHYDFNKKIRFYVNKCINCGSIWLNQVQMPLLSVAFVENTPEDLNFKKTINNLYEILAKRKAKKIRSLDEIIAPFAAMTGLLPAIPVGDNVLTKIKPIATRSIIIACAIIFVLQIAFKEILASFGLYADKVAQGEWYRLITYAFLHGGIFHLLGNMFFLRIFGRTVEDELEWKRYLSLFALGAVVSGIFVVATITKKDIPCVGASGAISAIIGAYLILFPKAKLKFDVYQPLALLLPIPIRKIATVQISSMYYILLWIIMNIFFGMLQSGAKTLGIAYWGHIGGFIAGIIFIEVYKNLKRG